MSAEENKDLVRRLWEECLNTHDLTALGDYVAPNFVYHAPAPSIAPDLAQLIAAFPDCRYTLEDLLAVDHKVIIRWSWSGTHQGEIHGIAPTGKRVTTKGIEIERLVDGKVVEVWDMWDMFGFLQQLGVMPGFSPA